MSVVIGVDGSNPFRMGEMSTLASSKNLVAFWLLSLFFGMKCVIHLLQGHILNYKHSYVCLFGLFMILDHLLGHVQLIGKCFDSFEFQSGLGSISKGGRQ